MVSETDTPAMWITQLQRPGLVVVVVSLLVVLGSWGVGSIWGPGVATAATAGGASAAVGGVIAWVFVGLMTGPGASVSAGPMVGMMVRLVVTGAGAGLCWLGLGLEKRPVLIAALLSYLVLMATEATFLYRSQSTPGIPPKDETLSS